MIWLWGLFLVPPAEGRWCSSAWPAGSDRLDAGRRNSIRTWKQTLGEPVDAEQPGTQRGPFLLQWTGTMYEHNMTALLCLHSLPERSGQRQRILYFILMETVIWPLRVFFYSQIVWEHYVIHWSVGLKRQSSSCWGRTICANKPTQDLLTGLWHWERWCSLLRAVTADS